jgi:hypothetical protein
MEGGGGWEVEGVECHKSGKTELKKEGRREGEGKGREGEGEEEEEEEERDRGSQREREGYQND